MSSKRLSRKQNIPRSTFSKGLIASRFPSLSGNSCTISVSFMGIQALLLLRRPLTCRSDRWLLMLSLFVAYMDLGTDVGAAVTFYRGRGSGEAGVKHFT